MATDVSQYEPTHERFLLGLIVGCRGRAPRDEELPGALVEQPAIRDAILRGYSVQPAAPAKRR
jgi:hypothetical protein